MRRRTRLGLTAALLLALALDSSAGAPPPPGLLGQFVWSLDETGFGGFSGIEMRPDGSGMVVLSDRGRVISADLRRDAQGAIVAVEAGSLTTLMGRGDAPLAQGRGDSEGLAIAEDGGAYISFEGAARVLRYARLDGPAENLPSLAEFARLQRNSALEALAIAPDGALYTLPERSGGDALPFPVWRFAGGQWTMPFRLPRQGHFLPVAADFGPDGRLYILEREFHGLFGFSSRVRALTLSQGAPLGEEIVMESAAGQHDNLEGLSVWRDAAGHLTLSMISDDNFSRWQETQIVEYRISG